MIHTVHCSPWKMPDFKIEDPNVLQMSYKYYKCINLASKF